MIVGEAFSRYLARFLIYLVNSIYRITGRVIIIIETGKTNLIIFVEGCTLFGYDIRR